MTTIQKAMQCDKAAFSELIQENASDMYRIARAILENDEDAADAIQDAILSCWLNIRQLREEKYFRTWLIRILIRKCYDIRNKSRGTALLSENQEISVMDKEYETIEWKIFLESMPEVYRTPLLLYYLEGFKIREIAQILDLNVNTVKARIAAGRKKLRSSLREGGASNVEGRCI